MVIGALGLVEEGMEKYNQKIQGSVKIQELQKMNLFGTLHIPIRVLTFGPKSGLLGFNTTLLGLTINDTLTWNDHVENLSRKRQRNCTFLFNLSVRMFPLQSL